MKNKISAADFAVKLNVTAERVRQLCKAGRILGAKIYRIGGISIWLIPSQAEDPRLECGRPRKYCSSDPPITLVKTSKTRIFEKIKIDSKAVRRRLLDGRREAKRIIEAMKAKGVYIELFGSMKTGHPFPNSDIDLLVIDCGKMETGVVAYEIDLLSGDIPVDVTFLQFVPKAAMKQVLESLNSPITKHKAL